MKSIDRAIATCDGLQTRIAFEESDAMKRDKFDRAGRAAHFKAGCVVWLMASLEALFREFADELRQEVNVRCAESELLHANLTAAMSQGQWQSASTSDRHAVVRRIDFVASHVLGTDDWPVEFSFDDGRTVNEATFLAVWRALGLAGPTFTNPVQATTLKDLCLRRNRVAHGEESVEVAGRSLSFQDVYSKVGHVNDVLTNMTIATEQWLDDAGWRA